MGKTSVYIRKGASITQREEILQGWYRQQLRELIPRYIAKLEKKRNTITAFWDFFEATITRYKGVKTDNFVYYLKEAEFKFNYAETEQFRLLSALWFVK